MGKINSRAKGASAERSLIKELSEYLGDALTEPMKRNLEQTRKGGHDIVGLDGFAIEVKRYRRIKEGDIVKFWAQAVDQAKRVGSQPVLAYREDFCSWRVRIPWGFLMDEEWDEDVDFTIEVGLKAFATIVREKLHSALQSNEPPHNIAS